METERETAGVTLRAVPGHVRDAGGPQAVTRVPELAGETRPEPECDDPRRWWSYQTKIQIFDAAATVLSDPQIGLHVGQTILDHSVNTSLRLGLLLLGGPGNSSGWPDSPRSGRPWAV